MHDLIGHRLSLIALHAGALELHSARDAPGLHDEAVLVRTTARTALDELRQVLGILRVDVRPGGTEGPDDGAGTRGDVTALVETSRRAGLAVELAWTGDDLDGVDARTRRAVHRVVREALTNAHKHAAAAVSRVRVSRHPAEVLVEVTSDAAGSPHRRAEGTGLGLIGLRERVELAGGSFEAGRRDGRFTVTAVLPITP
jgi:signal transduction histidine kinase